MSSKTTVRIALDWTPNTIHSGLFIAAAKGLYNDAGLDVQLLSPDESYSETPAKRLEKGDVELAVCPSESCIAYAKSGRMKLQAIYAILQRDASAIASTKLSRVSELGDGKVYGSYNARYEDRIVQAMVAKDGGNADGVKIESQTGKHSLFDAVKKGEIDATWVFMPWEGVEAEEEGTGLHAFRMAGYGIPYGYSPVIARNASVSGLSEESLRKFVKATSQGYAIAVKDAQAAVEALVARCNPKRSEEFLSKSQASINEFYSDGSTLGTMSEEKWKTWVNWLAAQGLMKSDGLSLENLFTNDFH